MIINHKYKFIFIHIQKTAGTSITDFLFKIDGTERVGNNHSFIKDNEIKNLDEYFKFCFVRNPFDRLVSWYNMMLKKGIHNDFSKYLLENSTNFSEFLDLTDIIYETNEYGDNLKTLYPKSISFNQLDYISDNEGNIAVDFIGRYENINDDFEFIKNKIGITNIKLKHLNKFEHRDYREYYSDKDIEKVYKMYERDINYFNYELPENFDWKFYLEYYEDLRLNSFKTEQDAKIHYLNYGKKEARIYNLPNPVKFFDKKSIKSSYDILKNHNEENIDVSVIITSYNYENYIKKCVDSVIDNKSNLKVEIFIIDDNSTDNSLDIIKGYLKTENNITVVNKKINTGLTDSRNLGLKISLGKYVFILDADNYIYKDCLIEHYNLIHNSDFIAVYGIIECFDIKGELVKFISDSEFDFNRLKNGNYIDAMAMFNREEIVNLAGYDSGMSIHGKEGWEDYDLWLNIGHNKKKVGFINKPQSAYLIKDDSMLSETNKYSLNLKKYLNKKYFLLSRYHNMCHIHTRDQQERKVLLEQNKYLQQEYSNTQEKNVQTLQIYHKQLETSLADYINQQKNFQKDIAILRDENNKLCDTIKKNQIDLAVSLNQEKISKRDYSLLENKFIELQNIRNSLEQDIILMYQSRFWKLRTWYLSFKKLFLKDITTILSNHIFNGYWALRNPLKFIKKYIWKKCPSYHQIIWAIKNPKRFLYKYKTGHYNSLLKMGMVDMTNIIGHNLPTENDFSKLCLRLLKHLPKTFPVISKSSYKKSVLVETRILPHTEFVIKNTIQKLGDGWGHIIFCSKENSEQIRTICKSISDEIEIILLPYEIRSRDDYNNFCFEDFFWKSLKCEKVLIYQTDTIILKEFDPAFLEYDYIGGPWGDYHTRHIELFFNIPNLYCGNGGLSLRSVSVMREFLNLYKIPLNKNFDQTFEKIPEDTFFSMHTLLREKKYPSLQIAWEFASEFEINPTSFGIHQPWKFFQSDIEMQRHIEKIFFQKNKKRILFINHEESNTGAPNLLKDIIEYEHSKDMYDVWTLSLRINDNPWEIPNLLRYDDIPGNSDVEKVSYIMHVYNPDVVYANTIVVMDVAKHFECFKIINIHEYRSCIPYVVNNEIMTLKNFDRVIVACEPAKKLLNSVGITSEVIPYYINSNKIQSLLPLVTEKKLYIGLGYAQLRKGLHRFIEIAESLPDEEFIWVGSLNGVDIQGNMLIIRGYNFQLPDYKINEDNIELIHYEIEIPKNVSFVGLKPQTEILKYYLPKAKCLLMLSTDDPFPLVVIEAKLLNTNVVTLKDSGDSYKLCDSNDLVLDSYDHELIVSYLSNLIPNKFRYQNSLAEYFHNNSEINRMQYIDFLEKKTKVFTVIDSDSNEYSYLLLEKTLRSFEKFPALDVKVITDKKTENLLKIKTHAEIIYAQCDIGAFVKKERPRHPSVAGSLYRLEIPRICKERGYQDRYVLYCDYDIICNMDVTKFLPRGGVKYFAATPEWKKNDFSYFNSGIMWMNVSSMYVYYNKLSQYIRDNLDNLPNYDQDALNIIFKNKISHLDNRLNWKPYWGFIRDYGIIHYHWLKPNMVVDKGETYEKIKNNFSRGIMDLDSVKQFFYYWNKY